MSNHRAYSPASLSFIFKKIANKDLLKTGSVGIGCTLNKGVTAEVKKSLQTKIYLNGKPINFPTVQYGCLLLTDQPVKIALQSPLPLGFGFGISAASTLTALFAINQSFALGKTRDQLAEIAHKAEIINHTGLGSVGTQVRGGFILKKTAGIPFASDSLPFIGKKVYAIVIDRLETPTVINNNIRLEKINHAADKALMGITEIKNPSLSQIIDCSYNFARKSFLLSDKKVITIIEKIRQSGGHATMAMLGNVVISSVNFQIKNYPTYSLTISNDKVSLHFAYARGFSRLSEAKPRTVPLSGTGAGVRIL